MATTGRLHLILHLPGGYTLRPATLQDLDSVLQLRVAQDIADYDHSGLTAAALRDTWLASNFTIGLDHWLVFDPGGKPAAYAEVRDHGSGTSFQAVLAMPGLPGASAGEADAATCQAVTAALIEQIEHRAGKLAGNQSPEISTRISVRNERLRQALESASYRRFLTFNIMEADLTIPPAALVLPEGVTIRTFVPNQDDQAVYRVDEEASEDKGYHQPLSYEAWCKRMSRHTPLFDPSLWFLAFVDGELAGVALNIYDPETETGWVDHLSVRRAFRRRGIGMALLLHSINIFHQRCYPFARLSVDSHSLTHAPRLYERAGFQTVLGYHIYEKKLD